MCCRVTNMKSLRPKTAFTRWMFWIRSRRIFIFVDLVMPNIDGKKLCKIVTAEDGLCAMDVLDTMTPDVVFVDLVMPNIDGKKLCKIIRGIKRFKDTYLIILSAVATEERIDIEKLGVNACIAKGPLKRMERLIHEVLDHPDAATLRCRAGEVIGAEKSSPRTITNELLNVGKHFEAIMEVMSEGILEVTLTGRII